MALKKRQYRFDDLTITLIEILADQKGVSNTELVRNAVFQLAMQELPADELQALIAAEKIAEEFGK